MARHAEERGVHELQQLGGDRGVLADEPRDLLNARVTPAQRFGEPLQRRSRARKRVKASERAPQVRLDHPSPDAARAVDRIDQRLELTRLAEELMCEHGDPYRGRVVELTRQHDAYGVGV